jgi:peptidyl-prolyl cis-trans isomerase C
VLSTATQRLLLNEAQETLDRALSDGEIDQALREWEEETLLVEDARRLGLDRDDPIVRRRLAEKMRYLLEDAATTPAPSDEALTEHLTHHPAQFMLPAEVALDQRFFSRARRGAGMDADARAALLDLLAGRPNPGDPHPLGESLPMQTERALARRLGPAFARHALEAPLGSWSGPITSPTGLHVMRINAHQPSRRAALDEQRPHIEASWRERQREQRLRAQMDALRRRRGLPRRRAP